ncbi:MAG: diguanylate cyclase [Pseudolabrys sp.]
MHIALADPSQTVRRIVKSMLESWGHQVTTYDDVPETLDGILANKDIRALITTAEHTSGSGAQLAYEARRIIGIDRPLYIIVMSCARQQTALIEALENGADDFINKPPAPEELKARLRAAERLTGMQAELIKLANTDALTGLLNRRAFFDGAKKTLTEAAPNKSVSALICDIDFFKSVNDTYGHDAGDAVLRAVAAEARKLPGIVGRIGGEEFAFLLNMSLNDAADAAESFRQSISRLVTEVGDRKITATCSLGAAGLSPDDTIDSLLQRADVALYRAKHSGRNRVVTADTDWPDVTPTHLMVTRDANSPRTKAPPSDP